MLNARPITLQVATLYAELHDLSELDVLQGRNPGSFSVKTINGRRYWYKQHWIGKNVRLQKTIGVETPELLDNIARWKSENAAVRKQKAIRRELCRAIKAALRMTVDAASGRVIAALADKLAFEKGAVLIGTHAYISYAAMLGRELSQANMQTGDIDFAVIDIAADATTLLPQVVESLDKAFFPVPARPGEIISTKLKHRTEQIRIELLTPHRQGDIWTAIAPPRSDFGAQQVPYLDYLIEAPLEATYLHDDGVRVRVPNPARFCLHKLIVAANRDLAARSKTLKDLAQAAELMAILAEDSPHDLREAYDALAARGGDYLTLAKRGAASLSEAARQALPALLR